MDKKGAFGGLEAIEEYLLCFICMGNIKEAVMCPHCSKVGCHGCMTRWLGKQKECPHCRKRVEISQLVKCRFIDDVQGHLNKIKKARILEHCPRHDQPYAYYCTPCKQSVCADCVMFSTEPHHGHSIRRVDEVYKEKVALVLEDAEASRQRSVQLKDVVRRHENLIETLEKNKQTAESHLKAVHLSAQEKVEEIVAEKRVILQTQLKIIREFSEAIDTSIESFQTAFDEKLKNSFIINAPEFSSLLQKHRVNSLEVNFKEIDLDLPTGLAPTFDHHQVYRLADYRAQRSAETTLFSQTLVVDGQAWRLKIYPNGNRHARNTYLSIYLELLESDRIKAARYQYKIELTNFKDLSANCVRCDSSEFKKGDCWGYNKFLGLNVIESFLQDDVLEIKFSVTPLSYSVKCEDLARKIESLEKMLGTNATQETQETQEAPKQPFSFEVTPAVATGEQEKPRQKEKEKEPEKEQQPQESPKKKGPEATPEPPRRSREIVQEQPEGLDDDDDLPPLIDDDEFVEDEFDDGVEENLSDEDEDHCQDEELESAALDHIMRHIHPDALARLQHFFGANDDKQ